MAHASARIHDFLAAAAATFRQEGAEVFAQKTAASLGLRRIYLLAADTAAMPTTSEAQIPLDLRWLRPTELELLFASQPEIRRSRAERDLAAGRLCLVALHEGKIVGSSFIARDAITSVWARVNRPLAKDEAYVYAAHTVPALRSRGINSALNARLAVLLRETGVRRTFRLVLPWNHAALTSSHKSGFMLYGEFLSVGLGGWSRTWLIPRTADPSTANQPPP